MWKVAKKELHIFVVASLMGFMKNRKTKFFFTIAWSNHLWVLKYFEIFVINLFKILEDICQLSGVILYEFTVNKARALIEQVIKRLNIK